MSLKIGSLGTLAFSLSDCFLTTDPRYRSVLKQAELIYLRRSNSVMFAIWGVIFVLHFFGNDLRKEPLWVYAVYRLGVAACALVAIFITKYAKSSYPIYMCSWLFAALICTTQSWSMTLGYEIQLKWAFFLPALTLAASARSFVASTTFWILVVFLNHPFWGAAVNQRFVTSDSILCVAFILTGHYFFKGSLERKALEVERNLLASTKEEQIATLIQEVERFVPPVIVKRIRNSILQGEHLVTAIDSILRRRKATYSVLYSDLRNFSSRSHHLSFIENELIPSLRLYVDSSEQNQGVARTIGDALFIYYQCDDPEESLLRSVSDAYAFEAIERKRRGNVIERSFIVTYGEGFVGNMISDSHRETTVMGLPANLGSRIDSVLKVAEVKSMLMDTSSIVLDARAWVTLRQFAQHWDYSEIPLTQTHMKLKTYDDETHLYLLHITKTNTDNLKRLNSLNGIALREELPWSENLLT